MQYLGKKNRNTNFCPRFIKVLSLLSERLGFSFVQCGNVFSKENSKTEVLEIKKKIKG